LDKSEKQDRIECEFVLDRTRKDMLQLSKDFRKKFNKDIPVIQTASMPFFILDKFRKEQGDNKFILYVVAHLLAHACKSGHGSIDTLIPMLRELDLEIKNEDKPDTPGKYKDTH